MKLTEAFPYTEAVNLRDQTREPHPEPCPDCGRTYIQGEHIVFTVPTPEPNGYRVVWEGCVDCWVRRTSPGGLESSP